MKIYKELTYLHQRMCHIFYEYCKNNSDKIERDEVLGDIQKLEEIACKYLHAFMDKNGKFTSNYD